MILTKELRAILKQWRESSVVVDGRKLPGSVPFIRGMLVMALDPHARDELMGALADEYFRANLDDEHLLVQRERLAAHPDASVMWIGLADSLSFRADGAAEAKTAVARGVEIAKSEGALIRYALISQANIARRLNDAALFEQSISQLIDDARVDRPDDAGLTEELVADLPDGFCSAALVSKYRSLLG